MRTVRRRAPDDSADRTVATMTAAALTCVLLAACGVPPAAGQLVSLPAQWVPDRTVPVEEQRVELVWADFVVTVDEGSYGPHEFPSNAPGVLVHADYVLRNRTRAPVSLCLGWPVFVSYCEDPTELGFAVTVDGEAVPVHMGYLHSPAPERIEEALARTRRYRGMLERWCDGVDALRPMLEGLRRKHEGPDRLAAEADAVRARFRTALHEQLIDRARGRMLEAVLPEALERFSLQRLLPELDPRYRCDVPAHGRPYLACEPDLESDESVARARALYRDWLGERPALGELIRQATDLRQRMAGVPRPDTAALRARIQEVIRKTGKLSEDASRWLTGSWALPARRLTPAKAVMVELFPAIRAEIAAEIGMQERRRKQWGRVAGVLNPISGKLLGVDSGRKRRDTPALPASAGWTGVSGDAPGQA